MRHTSLSVAVALQPPCLGLACFGLACLGLACLGLACLGLAVGPTAASAQDAPNVNTPAKTTLTPFLLGGIQTHELDHQRWMAALHQNRMNAVQVTVYAHQGPWNTAKLWYAEEEPAVLREIRAARQNGLQVVLILRVALDHNEPENRFLWHGLTYPETEEATAAWFRTYSDFVVKWGRIAEQEGVEVLGIASEMNALAATLPVDEVPGLADYYLDDASQERLRQLVGRSAHLFTEDLRLSMGAGDFANLDDFLRTRNQAERAWATTYTFADQPTDRSAAPESDAEAELADRLAAINQRRALLEAHWRDVAKRARNVFSGRLTLAANFDNYHEVAFWDALDFIGINAYFPLRESLETPLSEAGLTDAWQEIFAKIDAFRSTHELTQPVVFTELGYTRWQGVTVAPWSSQGFIPLWDPDGLTENDRAFFWSAQPIEPQERALAMRALHQLWNQGRADLAGVLYWKLSSRIDLQRYEPFMLFLGEQAGDPLLEALTRFADGIRPLGPQHIGNDPYRRAVDAIVRNDLDTLKQLGNQHAAPPKGHPPLLHLAVRLGRGPLVQHLLNAGADRDARDDAGFLPIHWTCYQPDPNLVTHVLPSKPAPWRDDDGETPLMKCARLDNAAVARQLLRHGDPVDARNHLGKQALHLAADQASKPTIEQLVAAAGDGDAQDAEGTTPLHLAARRGDLDIVQALSQVSEGRANHAGYRPVHEAAFAAKADVFRLLFDPTRELGANSAGQSLLHLAAYGGNLEILQALIPHVSTVDLEDREGATPLFDAIKDGHVEAVALLLAHGASVGHRAADGTTPFHHGASCSESRVLQHFLGQEIDLDLVDGKGNTALHHAAGWGILENIRLLLAAGADTTVRNREGDTALDVAIDSGRRRAAELLRAAVANVSAAETSPAEGEHPPEGAEAIRP